MGTEGGSEGEQEGAEQMGGKGGEASPFLGGIARPKDCDGETLNTRYAATIKCYEESIMSSADLGLFILRGDKVWRAAPRR